MVTLITYDNAELSDHTADRIVKALSRDGRDVGEYLVLSATEQLDAVSAAVLDSLWAFSPIWLANATGLPVEVFVALAENNKREDNNSVILKLVEVTCGLNSIVTKAVADLGAGQFLSAYDWGETIIDLKFGRTVKQYYCYRTN